MRGILRRPLMLLSAFAVVALPGRAGAQAHTATVTPRFVADTVTVIPGPGYRAGGLARVLLGSGWRDVWLTPVDAPVFDLDSYAGGLRPVRLGGGFQTITLHLVEEDGWREYRFRSVDKFPERQAMPPSIRGTPAGALIQDQVSTLFPAAPLLVPPLLRAIRALHVPAELYVMPDAPRLGEHRRTFAGLLGTVELKPDDAPDDEPGFAGSRAIKGTEQFLVDVDASRAHRLDEHEFLAVRLIDFLINDTDRTPDNFEWARFPADGDDAFLWRPIARDRDRAFMDARGWLNSLLMRRFYPKLTAFEPAYSLEGLTHTSFTLDRRLLQRLTRADFEDVAARVQRAIDQDLIDSVIASVPARWREHTTAAERLRDVLLARRDGLPAVARDFYLDLAGEVDVHGTSEDEDAGVRRHEDGRVTVTIGGRDDLVEIVRHDDGRVTLVRSEPQAALAGDSAFYRRTFLPAETREVRLYLGGGADLAIVRGAASSAIIVRVIGGAGDDVLVDSAGGGATYFYDGDGDDRLVTASDTHTNLRPWMPPEPATGLRLGKAWSPDWGGSSGWSGTIGYAEGTGIVVGFGPERTRYGFRRLPHATWSRAQVLAGPGSGRFGVRADTEYRGENSPLALTLAVSASQLDPFRFSGYGNDTPEADRDLTLVQQTSVAIEPALVWHIGWRSREGLSDPLRAHDVGVLRLRPLVGRLHAGPLLYWSDPEPRTGSPLALTSPAGSGAFGRVAFRIGVELDRTDREPVPSRGWTFDARLAAYPPLWDVDEAFSTAAAVGAGYLPLRPGGTNLAVRAGAGLGSGPVPVQHAPAIGGRTTLRGYPWQRYTGDAAVYGSTELRVPTGAVSLFVRWQTGAFVLVDAGRVWFDGRSDGGWHTGLGGGLWLTALGRGVSLAYARGSEHRLYLESGVSF